MRIKIFITAFALMFAASFIAPNGVVGQAQAVEQSALEAEIRSTGDGDDQDLSPENGQVPGDD